MIEIFRLKIQRFIYKIHTGICRVSVLQKIIIKFCQTIMTISIVDSIWDTRNISRFWRRGKDGFLLGLWVRIPELNIIKWEFYRFLNDFFFNFHLIEKCQINNNSVSCNNQSNNQINKSSRKNTFAKPIKNRSSKSR